MVKYLSLSPLPTLRFATKFHPYLTVRWVTMVKSQRIIVLKKRKWSLGYTVSLFCTCTLYCLSFLNCSPSSDFVGLLTHNHINSARDTLQPSPPEFSTQQIFCLVRKAVWSWVGGRDIMWMQVERQEEKERVLVCLLNQKSDSWIINGSEQSRWCGMASSALMQPPTLFSAMLWLHTDKSDVSNVANNCSAIQRNSFCLERRKWRPRLLDEVACGLFYLHL